MSYETILAGVLLQGPLADMPAASVGRYWYLADDEDGGTLYHSDGVATWTQAAAGVSAGGGAVDSVTAGDTSVMVDNTDPANPLVATGTLDVIATNHAPVADWSNNSKKITDLDDGVNPQDAATVAQLPSPGIASWGLVPDAALHGSGSPAGVVTPAEIGDLYVDDGNARLWQATGATNADWEEIARVSDIPTSTADLPDSTDARYVTDDEKDALDNANAPDAGNPVATIADIGAAGVSSLAKSGSTPLTGAVTLSEGANVTLTQVGQDIAIASTAGGTGTVTSVGSSDSSITVTSPTTTPDLVIATVDGGSP